MQERLLRVRVRPWGQGQYSKVSKLRLFAALPTKSFERKRCWISVCVSQKRNARTLDGQVEDVKRRSTNAGFRSDGARKTASLGLLPFPVMMMHGSSRRFKISGSGVRFQPDARPSAGLGQKPPWRPGPRQADSTEVLTVFNTLNIQDECGFRTCVPGASAERAGDNLFGWLPPVHAKKLPFRVCTFVMNLYLQKVVCKLVVSRVLTARHLSIVAKLSFETVTLHLLCSHARSFSLTTIRNSQSQAS